MGIRAVGIVESTATAVVADIAPRQPSRLRRGLVALDATAGLAAWTATLVVSAAMGATPDLRQIVEGAAAMTAITMGLIASHRLYFARVSQVRSVEIGLLARVAFLSAIAGDLLNRATGVPHLRTPLIIGGSALSFLLVAMTRGAFGHWLRAQRATGAYVRPIVVIGGGNDALDLVEMIEQQPDLGYRVEGVIGDRDGAAATGAPWLGELADASTVLVDLGIHSVLIASGAAPQSELNRLIRALHEADMHVHLSSGVGGMDYRRLRPLPLGHEPLFYLEKVKPRAAEVAAKRVLDIALTAVALLLTLPVLAASAIAIKLQDGGPILFKHQRIGRDGKPFMIFKLRTMVTDAESQLSALQDDNERAGPLFKVAFDPRVTRVGRILRASSIDELPQLLNVLRGEMSLVGPRPALPNEVEQFDDELLTRLQVPPGITGLWQVEARDNPSFHAYRRLDLFYVRNWSIALDIGILLATVQAVIARVFRRSEVATQSVTLMARRDASVIELRDEVPSPLLGALELTAADG